MTARDGLQCVIGDRRYVVDTEDMTWLSVKPNRQGVDQAAGAGEGSLTNDVVWRRVRDSWKGGAGQAYADLVREGDESSPIRYSSSVGVVQDDDGCLTLDKVSKMIGHFPVDVGPTYYLDGGNVIDNLARNAYQTQVAVDWVHVHDASDRMLATTTDGTEHGFRFSVQNRYLKLEVNNIVGGVSYPLTFTATAQCSDWTRGLYGFLLRQNGANIDVEFWEKSRTRGVSFEQGARLTGGTKVGATVTVAASSLHGTRVGGPLQLSNFVVDAWVGVGTSATTMGSLTNLTYIDTIFDASGWEKLTGPSYLYRHTPPGNHDGLVTVDSSPDDLNDFYTAGAIVPFPSLATQPANVTTRVITAHGLGTVSADPFNGIVMNDTWISAKSINVNLVTTLPDGTVFVADDNEVWQWKRDNTYTLLYAGTFDMIAACGSRLIASDGAELFEIGAGGTKTTIYTHWSDAFKWRGALNAPNGIYAWGMSQVFQIPVSDATGALDPPIPALTLSVAEPIITMIEHLGIMVLSTVHGVRVATIQGDGSLTVGSVIADPLKLDELGVVGDKVIGIGSPAFPINPPPGGYTPQGQIWEFDLTTFTNAGTLTPAYRELSNKVIDLDGDELGNDEYQFTIYSRGIVEAIYGAGSYDEMRTVLHAAGGYVAERSTTFVDEGPIDLGWFSYGIGELISLDSITVECEPLEPGSSWEVEVHVDSPDQEDVLTGTLDFLSGHNLTLYSDETDVRAQRFKVRLVLRGDTSENTAPKVCRVVLRVAPAPFMSDEILLPLILSDMVESEHGQQVGLSPWTEFSYLLSLRDTRQRVPFQLGNFSGLCRVEGVEVRSGGLGGGNGIDGWDEKSEWVKGKWTVRVVTMEGSGSGFPYTFPFTLS